MKIFFLSSFLGSVFALLPADGREASRDPWPSASAVGLLQAAPSQQEMGENASLLNNGAAGGEGLYRVCYICSECLERNRECFPVCMCVAYGRQCASCCCNASPAVERQMEESARFVAIPVSPSGEWDGPPQPPCCTYRNCGNPYDYHCTGEIVKNHCYLCLTGCVMTASFVICCVKLC